jgi:hypothetical protein
MFTFDAGSFVGRRGSWPLLDSLPLVLQECNVSVQTRRFELLLDGNLLFKSRIARFAPLKTNALLIARPSPLAPPVMIAVLPASEKEDSVGIKADMLIDAFT